MVRPSLTAPREPELEARLRAALAAFPAVTLALVFGSVAKGRARPDSDVDVAVQGRAALSAQERTDILAALAAATGRPIDLVDLTIAPEPLLGQIVRHGRRLLGDDGAYARLISRHLFEEADFMPYRRRILAERRMAWIGM
ncbi:MAG: type VII toxin-antitoxin system MntA family adenylyltransferase antitoxin [Casimicrobiaceae bacterium]